MTASARSPGRDAVAPELDVEVFAGGHFHLHERLAEVLAAAREGVT